MMTIRSNWASYVGLIAGFDSLRPLRNAPGKPLAFWNHHLHYYRETWHLEGDVRQLWADASQPGRSRDEKEGTLVGADFRKAASVKTSSIFVLRPRSECKVARILPFLDRRSGGKCTMPSHLMPVLERLAECDPLVPCALDRCGIAWYPPTTRWCIRCTMQRIYDSEERLATSAENAQSSSPRVGRRSKATTVFARPAGKCREGFRFPTGETQSVYISATLARNMRRSRSLKVLSGNLVFSRPQGSPVHHDYAMTRACEAIAVDLVIQRARVACSIEATGIAHNAGVTLSQGALLSEFSVCASPTGPV